MSLVIGHWSLVRGPEIVNRGQDARATGAGILQWCGQDVRAHHCPLPALAIAP
ncbi:hypothetical protein NG798_18920 [Ancylothrix sp. C2]|uniref:hypothetical protein n=1 Tax=Ancylothrix sp. D3o TaxID=2953691 RepID=UPI0021BB73A9|nr:hypothetical protein [Ancylothrix sp. D3o]MCT7951877.1 hypothetical protein [Ancylothrix sp. D3o]